jgi:penicillin-binding protein 1C
LPGATYLVDPDVRSSRRIPLLAAGGEKLRWQSESLRCTSENGEHFAIAEDGDHQIAVRDPETGRSAEIRISVRSM